MRQFFLLAIPLAALVVLGGTPSIRASTAAEARVAAEKCDIEQELQAFLAAKDRTGNESAIPLVLEFRLHRSLLETTIGCMRGEADALSSLFRDLRNLKEDLAGIRDTFLITLDKYRGTIDDNARRLQKISELGDIKQLAKDLLTWREETYRPALQQMLTLFYVVRVEEAQQTALTRLQKINAALRTLGLAGNRELRALLDKAARQLTESETLNIKARGLLLAALRPAPASISVSAPQEGNRETPQSTSTLALTEPVSAVSATSTENAALEAKEEVPAPEPKELAKNALLKIRDAYRLFINASEVVRRIFK